MMSTGGEQVAVRPPSARDGGSEAGQRHGKQAAWGAEATQAEPLEEAGKPGGRSWDEGGRAVPVRASPFHSGLACKDLGRHQSILHTNSKAEQTENQQLFLDPSEK